MKIVRYEDTMKRGEAEEVPLRDAVTGGVMHTSYGSGHLEDMASQIDALSKVVGVLAEVVYNAGLMGAEQLDEVVRYPFTVAAD